MVKENSSSSESLPKEETSKRCKDEDLRGTVKEVITQVSRSKKWESKPVLDEDGNPMLNARGKKILRSSYSVLQSKGFILQENPSLHHYLAVNFQVLERTP